ncbi:MAG: sigma-54 factor interaction domain-containing protein [Paracoccaceae bacterium]
MADYKNALIGSHPDILALRKLVERVAKSPVRTVLIYGETGTGKGLVARMIHRASSRAAREFVDLNCAAIPASLMESELFGHERGAFTGAVERKLGLVEAANQGSIFLDEIREMDLTLQAKLLSLLDTQQFRRVGAVKSTSVDVRFIAATNKVLLSEVKSGKFREDLYYRLQVVALNIPALRERRGEDVISLSSISSTATIASMGGSCAGCIRKPPRSFAPIAGPAMCASWKICWSASSSSRKRTRFCQPSARAYSAQPARKRDAGRGRAGSRRQFP